MSSNDQPEVTEAMIATMLKLAQNHGVPDEWWLQAENYYTIIGEPCPPEHVGKTAHFFKWHKSVSGRLEFI